MTMPRLDPVMDPLAQYLRQQNDLSLTPYQRPARPPAGAARRPEADREAYLRALQEMLVNANWRGRQPDAARALPADATATVNPADRLRPVGRMQAGDDPNAPRAIPRSREPERGLAANLRDAGRVALGAAGDVGGSLVEGGARLVGADARAEEAAAARRALRAETEPQTPLGAVAQPVAALAANAAPYLALGGTPFPLLGSAAMTGVQSQAEGGSMAGMLGVENPTLRGALDVGADLALGMAAPAVRGLRAGGARGMAQAVGGELGQELRGLQTLAGEGRLAPGLSTMDVGGADARRPRVAASNLTDATLSTLFDDVTPEQAMQMARRGEHLKQSATTGQYVGGPPGMDSPQKLAAVRRSADDKVARGAFNADWYDRRRSSIGEAAGFDPATMAPESPEGTLANLMSRGSAAYSPQASPTSEMQWFLRQHLGQTVGGQQLQPRFLQQAENVGSAYRYNAQTGQLEIDPAQIELANKTGGYADAGNPTVNADELFRTANDQWHARVMGFVHPDGSDWTAGLTDAQHGYLTGENLLLADRANKRGLMVNERPFAWDPRSAQAATWGTARLDDALAEQAERVAKHEKKLAKYEAELAKWQAAKEAGKKVGPRPTKPAAPTLASMQELTDYAKAGTDDALDLQTAAINQEYTPGPSAFLSGFKGLPGEAQEAYARAQQQVWGQSNPILAALDQYQKPIVETMGVWRDPATGVIERNLGDVSRPIVSTEPTPTGKFDKKGVEQKTGQRLTPESKRLMETVSAIEGVTRGQYGTGMSKFTPANSSFTGDEKTGAFIAGPDAELGRAKSALETAGFDVIVDASSGGLHVGRFAPEGKTWNSDPGVAVSWPDLQKGKVVPLNGNDVQKRLRAALAGSGANNIEVTPGRLESGFEAVPWGEEGAGSVARYLENRLGQVFEAPARLDAAQVPQALAQRFQTAERFAREQGMGAPYRQDVAKLYDLLRADKGGGFQRFLQALRESGYAGLPAAAITIGGGAALVNLGRDPRRGQSSGQQDERQRRF